MTIHPYPFDLPAVSGLTEEQMDGQECVYCNSRSAAGMKPVGRLFGTLVFAHPDCAEPHRWEDE